MQLVEDEKAQVLVNGVAHSALPHAGQEQFQHHVVGQEYLRRVVAHLLTRCLPLLPCVLAEVHRERPATGVFVVLLITGELLKLGIDQGVHRIDDNGRYPRCLRVAEQMVEDRTNVRQRLAGPRARRDDEILAGSAQLDGLDLVPIQRIAGKNIGHIGMQDACTGKLRHRASVLEGWVELQEWFRPQLALAQLALNHLPNRRISNVKETANVRRVVVNNAGMDVQDIHMRPLTLLCSVMAGNTTTRYSPGEAAHIAGQVGKDAAYALMLYSHKSPSRW
jgi:hypothetical protein